VEVKVEEDHREDVHHQENTHPREEKHLLAVDFPEVVSTAGLLLPFEGDSRLETSFGDFVAADPVGRDFLGFEVTWPVDSQGSVDQTGSTAFVEVVGGSAVTVEDLESQFSFLPLD